LKPNGTDPPAHQAWSMPMTQFFFMQIDQELTGPVGRTCSKARVIWLS
jgi:hypothetical protein